MAKLYPSHPEDEEMVTYCLFCNTAKSVEVARRISEEYRVKALSPTVLQRKWIKGICTEEMHDYLPGYIFIYTERPIARYTDFARMDNVYRILGDAENGHELQGDDLRFAEMLYACDGTIGIMKAYKEGDRIRLAKGMLGNIDGEIVKTDRRGRALVRYRFDNRFCDVWVGYEMIENTVSADETDGKDL